MLIQRPAHVSERLNREYDTDTGSTSQASFFLRRHLSTEEASKRIFRTRTALREGKVVYLKGDVPWIGPNTRPAHFLGEDRSFQSLWAEFAALFRVPVVTVFCTHAPQGRYRLDFGPSFRVTRGAEDAAVRDYLALLESWIITHPADAVAHLLWPCYGPKAREAALSQSNRGRFSPRRAETSPSGR